MKKATPNQVTQVVTMRAAGWPLASIATKTSLSISTVQRICKRHQTAPGELQAALIEEAKIHLFDTCRSDKRLQDEFTLMLIDSIAQAQLGREKAVQALDILNPKTISEAALTMRALSAHATATKTYADMLRQMLPGVEVEPEMPEFIVKIISDEDVRKLRDDQEAEFEELMGTGEEDEEDATIEILTH